MNYAEASSNVDSGALVVNTGLELADGEIVTWPELNERGLEVTYVDEQGRLFGSEQDMQEGNLLGYDVEFAIPGARYPDVAGGCRCGEHRRGAGGPRAHRSRGEPPPAGLMARVSAGRRVSGLR